MDIVGIFPPIILIGFLFLTLLFPIIFVIIFIFIINKQQKHRKNIKQIAKELNLSISQPIPIIGEPELSGIYRNRKLRIYYEKEAGLVRGLIINIEVKLIKNIEYNIIIKDKGYFQNPSIKTEDIKFDDSWIIETKYPKFRDLVDSTLQEKILDINIPKNRGAEFNVLEDIVNFEILYGNLDDKKLKEIINLLCDIADKIEKLN